MSLTLNGERTQGEDVRSQNGILFMHFAYF